MKKKVVLITGTNSGFGWLTANSIAALGHKVYATIRDTEGKNAEKAKALSSLLSSQLRKWNAPMPVYKSTNKQVAWSDER